MDLAADPWLSARLDALLSREQRESARKAAEYAKKLRHRRQTAMEKISLTIDLSQKQSLIALRSIFQESPRLVLAAVDQAAHIQRAVRPGDARGQAAAEYAAAMRYAATCLQRLHTTLAAEAAILDKFDKAD